MNGLECDTGDFEDDTLMNGKPMKFSKRGSDVFMTLNIEHNPS